MSVGLIYGTAISPTWLALLLRSVPVYDNSKRRRTMIRLVAEHDEPPPVELAS